MLDYTRLYEGLLPLNPSPLCWPIPVIPSLGTHPFNLRFRVFLKHSPEGFTFKWLSAVCNLLWTKRTRLFWKGNKTGDRDWSSGGMVWERGLGEGLRTKKKEGAGLFTPILAKGTLFFPSSVVQRKVVFVYSVIHSFHKKYFWVFTVM